MCTDRGMPILLDDMTDPDRPVTRRELRDELIWLVSTLESKLASKRDLKKFATKASLKAFATKEDLKGFATKEDLKRFATKEDLKRFATKDELERGLKELHEHFDAVAESFRGR